MVKSSFVFVASLVFANVACATTDNETSSDSRGGQMYRWYEMGEEREIFIEDGQVAVFSDGLSKPQSNKLTSKSMGTLRLEKEFGSVRIYRTESAVNTKTLAGLSVPGASPVFRDTRSEGRRMALPGTILVQFKADTDESQARVWAQQAGMSLVRKQLFPKNSYVFLHQPGLASLEMANKLHKSSEIQWAQPDWWLEVSRR